MQNYAADQTLAGVLLQMGGICRADHLGGMYFQMKHRPKALPGIRTAPYPGFPTDLQSPLMAVCARADGQHTRWESIYGIAYYPHRTISYNIVIRKINQVNFQKSYEQLYCTSSPVSGSNRFIYASTTYPSESTLQPDTGFPFASTTVPFST